MGLLIILQVISAILWLLGGILILIWLLLQLEFLIVFIWWVFAFGCVTTGIWMLSEPLFRKRS